MVRLEHWFVYFFVLVLYSTESLCAQNLTSTSAVSNSTGSIQKNDVPVAFPQEPYNGKDIRTLNTTIDELSINKTQTNDTNLNDTKEEPGTTNVVQSDTNLDISENTTIANSTKVNNTSNVNATDSKYENETNTSQVKSNEINKDPGNKTISLSLNVTIQGNTKNINFSKVDTEVPDMLKTPDCKGVIPESLPNSTSSADQPVDTSIQRIQDGHNTEDTIRNASSTKEKLSKPGVPLVQGQLAAILAGVFVVISVIAYVGMLSWRRYLENRYGNRQMLVNEEEFNDDLRHFSI